MIGAIVDELAPDLVARNSIGHVGAAQLLLTAGDNPDRLRSEASFAALCGTSPVDRAPGRGVGAAILSSVGCLGQAATVGRVTVGASLRGAMVSRLM
jgi:transposase